MLKHWLALPLRNADAIKRRLDFTEELKNDFSLLENLRTQLRQIGDIERLASRISTQRLSPRDFRQLKTSLECTQNIKNLLKQEIDKGKTLFQSVYDKLDSCEIVAQRIEKEIVEDPPVLISKGGFVKDGVNAELDELRGIALNSKEYLAKMEADLISQTQIPSLKIGFTNVFGYYIEVRNTHKAKVPADWIRKQTLTGAERYITPELKEYEEKILNSQDRIKQLETDIFNALAVFLTDYIKVFLQNAKAVAALDCLCSYAQCALDHNYCKPEINSSTEIKITAGRHPVIEQQLPIGEEYIPNDVFLDDKTQQIMMITGPNMAGKSALLRQTALIMLMAQAGSFVPAEAVSAGYVDKIFTRVGASDNISSGESTFMVEMNEAAGILNNMTSRSLVLFDELGRGTSTYDGISIAQAIVEYIHEFPGLRAKTMFATHYHELNEMAQNFERIKNYNVSVSETGGKVIFMRKLVPGGSEHSFGIHVAKLAGMPKAVVERADQILKELERKDVKKTPKKSGDGYQLSFFQLDDPVLSQIRDEIKKIDINNLTPVEALNKLNEIKRITGVK